MYMYVCVYIYEYICMHIYVCSIYLHRYMHVYVCMYTYIYIYILRYNSLRFHGRAITLQPHGGRRTHRLPFISDLYVNT